MKRIGILTSGGDCPGLNAAIRAVAKASYNKFDVEIIGIKDGFKGLMFENYRIMKPEDFSGILTRGGTILGTARTPFKKMRKIESGFNKVKAMVDTYEKLMLDCIVTLGGNGTHKNTNLLREEGLNVIALPKTIDNDIWGTDISFGFHSAVNIATEVIDRIHTTADSHDRVMIVELMGHKAGWLTLYAGLAGGADVILIPEVPYSMDGVLKAIKKRYDNGKNFSILAVAEGAISIEESMLSKKEFKQMRKNMKYPSVSYRIADEISKNLGFETRVTIPGHQQRGGSPTPYDRVLATKFGAFSAKLISDKEFGQTISLVNNKVINKPIEEVAGKLKLVPNDFPLIDTGKSVGVSFGDE
ncbi:MAG: 6-phosphofructokinase [Eubacteriales bacterium]